MEKVTGRGVFFRARDRQTLAAWYRDPLGIAVVATDDEQSPWQQEGGPTVFAPFPSDNAYIGDPRNEWMMNFPVADLLAMVEQPRSAGIDVQLDPCS